MEDRDGVAGQTVVVVDDTPDNLRLLAGMLSEDGCDVRPARDGETALKHAARFVPDLILLDIMMPGLDGFEVCRRLKANPRTRDIPVIFLTALDDLDMKVKAFSLGGVDYVTKPFYQEEVIARVRTHLTIRRLQKELERQNRELEKLVNVDGLTQISNRFYFDEYIRQEWLKSARERAEISLVFLDIDYFKDYNDHYGHQEGDECLRQLARIFSKCARRPADLVARYGGEEFVVLLPHTDLKGAEHVAGNIRRALRESVIPHPKSKVKPYVTCSMGIACMIPAHDVSVDKFVSMADEALYLAKDRGRDQIAVREL